jgi:hypothetical protein
LAQSGSVDWPLGPVRREDREEERRREEALVGEPRD